MYKHSKGFAIIDKIREHLIVHQAIIQANYLHWVTLDILGGIQTNTALQPWKVSHEICRSESTLNCRSLHIRIKLM